MEKKEFETLTSWNTIYDADSVEWCPNFNNESLLAIGTYQVTSKSTDEVFDGSKQRKGRLYLGQISESSNTFDLLQTIDCSAVLDLKWSLSNKSLLASSASSGDIDIYSLSFENKNPPLLEPVFTFNTEDNILALSLEWSNRIVKEEPKLVVSSSNGFINLLNVDASGITLINKWKAHDFEAWIACFDAYSTNIIYTGGDDSKMKSYDIRSSIDSPSWTKRFDCGVTSLQSDLHDEYKLYSGGYDEIFRAWDTRSLKIPSKEINLGGGIWRIKCHPHISGVLITACMHGGFKLIRDLKESISYNEHDSLAYGVDWNWKNSNIIASCSFYDSLLKIWKIKSLDQ